MSSTQLTAPAVPTITTTTSSSNNINNDVDVVDNSSSSTTILLPENNLDIIQDMIDLSANHLEGLRTQCATSATLTQQEIRSLESKLVRYFAELLLTKARINERIPANGLPHTTGNELKQWLRVVGLSHDSLNVCLMRLSTLEQLLDQSDEELKEMLRINPSYREEEVRRLTKAMQHLRKCKELLNSGNVTTECSDNGGLEQTQQQQLTEQWYWDSWDRQHHHIHRGSIGNIGLTTASPRVHHRPNKQQQHKPTVYRDSASGRQSPCSEQTPFEHLHNNKPFDLNSMQGSTLTLTLTPSPPNSPFTPSSLGGLSGSGGGNTTTTNTISSHNGTPQRSKLSGTPPPLRKHQLVNNATPTHMISSDQLTPTTNLNIDNMQQTLTIANTVDAMQSTNHHHHHQHQQRKRLPTDPSPDSHSSASSDAFIEHNNNSTTSTYVPISPGVTGCMGHAISHRFTLVVKILSTCNLCQKQLFIGLKCKDCKYRCHKDCEPNVPPSCGLPREYVDEFKQKVKEQAGYGNMPTYASLSGGGGSPNLQTKLMLNAIKPRQHGDSSSPSSSCTSSTPSSPALFQLHQQQQQQHMGGNSSLHGYMTSSSNSSQLLHTPSALHKQQTSQFNFPDVTITRTNCNQSANCNQTQTLLYAAQLPAHDAATIAAAAVNEYLQQQQIVDPTAAAVATSATTASTTTMNNQYHYHHHNQSSNNSSMTVGTGSQMSTYSNSNASTTSSFAGSLTSTSTFYPRRISDAGVDRRKPFTANSEFSDTHKSNDSDKTVSQSGSTSASTDSDRTPVRLDSTEDGDSGNWRQNSLSLKEWDIPYNDVKLLSQIGKGRFGTVHRAQWHGDVAVKLLKEDYLDDEDMLENFKKEVADFKKTRHENLVLFMGACMNPPYLAIVTSLCKGYTLYTYIHTRREKFAINRTLIIAQQIAQGMGYLHARGIVHKDLRTKNIFIENGKVIITDFGLFSSTKLFYCDIGLGIPHNWLSYIAPELMRALLPRKPTYECLPFSHASDVYSFGTVWYELICGEFTFRDQPPESIIWQVGRGMKQSLANLQSGRDVKDLLMLCWTYERENRPDFARLLQLLEHLPKKRLARSPSHPINLSRSAESVF